jgi:hypothetical protein
MKKLILALVAVLGLGIQAVAAPSGSAPLTTQGGELQNGGSIVLGNYAGAKGTIAVYGLALCNITAGDIVVGPLNTTYTAMLGVSKTTTAGDVTAMGIALDTASYGAQVRVAIHGPVLATSALAAWTAGDTFAASGTAGYISKTSALTAGTYTSLSRTPLKGWVLNTKTPSAGGKVMVCVGCR